MAGSLPDKNYLARNSAIITVFRGLGAVSGIALDAFVVSRLGLGVHTDAFFAAYALPFVLIAILEHLTATVLVPIFVQLGHDEEMLSRHRLISSVLTFGGLLLGALGALGTLAASSLVAVQAPGLEPGGRKLALSLAWILFWLPLLAGVSAVLRAALNGLHRFAVASSCKLIGNLAALAVVLLAYQKLGIHALAYGFVLGGVMQVIVLLFAMWREGFTYVPTLCLREPRLAEVGRLMAYTLLGQAMSEGRHLIEVFVTSFLPAGSLSALRYASRIVWSIAGVMVGGIVTATLPLVSRSAALQDFGELKRVLKQGVRLLALVALPISAWLALASGPFLAVLFERGRFTSSDTALTSTLLVLMVPVIFLSRLVALTQTAFYARKDMLTPLGNIILTVAVYLALILLLYKPMGIYGLPVANSLALAVAAAHMVWLLFRSIGALDLKELSPFFARLSVALAATMAVMLIGSIAGRSLAATGLGGSLLELLLISIPSGLAFLVAFAALGIIGPERLRTLMHPTSLTAGHGITGASPPEPRHHLD